jgi:hypothetical protein
MASVNIALEISNVKEPSLNAISRNKQADAVVACPFDSVDECIEPFVGEVCVLVHDIVTIVEKVNFALYYDCVILLDVVEVSERLHGFTQEVVRLSFTIRKPEGVPVIAFKRRAQ